MNPACQSPSRIFSRYFSGEMRRSALSPGSPSVRNSTGRSAFQAGSRFAKHMHGTQAFLCLPENCASRYGFFRRFSQYSANILLLLQL